MSLLLFQKLPKELRIALHDTKLYLNNTDSEVQNLLVSNYRELQDVLFNKLDSSGELVKIELARVTKAVAIDNLTEKEKRQKEKEERMAKAAEATIAATTSAALIGANVIPPPVTGDPSAVTGASAAASASANAAPGPDENKEIIGKKRFSKMEIENSNFEGPKCLKWVLFRNV